MGRFRILAGGCALALALPAQALAARGGGRWGEPRGAVGFLGGSPVRGGGGVISSLPAQPPLLGARSVHRRGSRRRRLRARARIAISNVVGGIWRTIT